MLDTYECLYIFIKNFTNAQSIFCSWFEMIYGSCKFLLYIFIIIVCLLVTEDIDPENEEEGEGIVNICLLIVCLLITEDIDPENEEWEDIVNILFTNRMFTYYRGYWSWEWGGRGRWCYTTSQ